MAQFLVYSDKLSETLNKDKEIQKYYAVTANGKIASITQGIIVNSLRDNGKALDLRVDAILSPKIFTKHSDQIQIFEIINENTLKRIG
jgi:hypothetical protein